MNAALMPTVADYARIFEAECAQTYPSIDAFEQRFGYAVDLARLSAAARVLACPLKVNPPNWQHGRVLYALVRWHAQILQHLEDVLLLDIGTAKGFSALCVQWALDDAKCSGQVYSVDVIHPKSADRRNSVIECQGPNSLAELLAPWPESLAIRFEQSTGIDWLSRHPERIHFAFVDGKHTADAVATEAGLLANRQKTGDMVVFDDAQIPGVAAALQGAQKHYELEHLTAKPGRTYVIARRR